MLLHLPTLLLVLTMTAAVLAGAVLAVTWGGRLHTGLSWWGLGLVLNALSYPAFQCRQWGAPEFSVLATNILTALTLVTHTQALMDFQRGRVKPFPVGLVWLPVGMNLVGAVVLLHQDHWRNVLVAALQTLMVMVLTWQAWGPGLQSRRLMGRRVVLVGSILMTLMLGLRTVWMTVWTDWSSANKVPDDLQSLTYIVTLAVLLINSMGFVLMQAEHAIAQQHDLASHDRLTGLYNRVALMEAMEQQVALARRRQSPLAMLMMDIDHFKRVNDLHGHLVGDEVLRMVAQRAKSRLRASDLLARFGGEEFLALLPGTDVADAVAVGESIRQAVGQQPMVVKGESIAVTISIGVHAAIPGLQPQATEAMISICDEALYEAKHGGRNRVIAKGDHLDNMANIGTS